MLWSAAFLPSQMLGRTNAPSFGRGYLSEDEQVREACGG